MDKPMKFLETGKVRDGNKDLEREEEGLVIDRCPGKPKRIGKISRGSVFTEYIRRGPRG